MCSKTLGSNHLGFPEMYQKNNVAAEKAIFWMATRVPNVQMYVYQR
jgi:hypothetical protein